MNAIRPIQVAEVPLYFAKTALKALAFEACWAIAIPVKVELKVSGLGWHRAGSLADVPLEVAHGALHVLVGLAPGVEKGIEVLEVGNLLLCELEGWLLRESLGELLDVIACILLRIFHREDNRVLCEAS